MTEQTHVVAAPNVASVLRRATAAQHRDVERRLDLLEPGLTVDRYTQVLQGFARVHRTLEAELDRWLGALGGDAARSLELDRRRKVPLLRADLAQLGVELPHGDPFELRSSVEALGAMYVVEGATLGGAVVAPHVRRALGDAVPVSFFASYGPATARMWAAFRRALHDLVAPDRVDEAVRGAVRTFDLVAMSVCR